MKYNILIGGSAGQGMNTLSVLLEKVLKRQGNYVFSNKDYMSRVRGGHNFIQIRFGNEEVTSHYPELDMIIAFNQNTVDFHLKRLQDKGVVLCDEDVKVNDKRAITIPMEKIAKKAGNAKVFSTVAMGAMLKIFGLTDIKVEELFYEKWEEEIRNANLEAFREGYNFVEKKFDIKKGTLENTLLINTNEAIALGALAGGVSFYSGYPMTPSTSIMTYLSKKENDAKIVVEQMEDEIAAINGAIGASYAGVRAMTGTSGGGFSLMVEALGLAGMTETPLVIVEVQRPGPATGFPTRTEQSDLDFILTASHGEIPRMVISVRNPEDAFYQTFRALNIADKYQMVVIILNDQYLADATQTIPELDFTKLKINRYLAGKEVLKHDNYKRYKVTKNGISSRVIPGKFEGVTVVADSDEHNEEGHITESAEVRNDMMNKRMKRLEILKEELIEPDYIGVKEPELLIVAWGSMYGPIKESVKMLENEGIKVGALVFGDIYPLPTKLLKTYSKMADKIINVEQNYTGQLAKLIRQETGITMTHNILKYDGRQIDCAEIKNSIEEEVL